MSGPTDRVREIGGYLVRRNNQGTWGVKAAGAAGPYGRLTPFEAALLDALDEAERRAEKAEDALVAQELETLTRRADLGHSDEEPPERTL